MRSDYKVADRHDAGFAWASRLEQESGIRNLVGYVWDVESHCVSGCDTAWMLAYVCPRTWRSARSMVLRAIAGLKSRPGISLVTNASDADRELAREALGI